MKKTILIFASLLIGVCNSYAQTDTVKAIQFLTDNEAEKFYNSDNANYNKKD